MTRERTTLWLIYAYGALVAGLEIFCFRNFEPAIAPAIISLVAGLTLQEKRQGGQNKMKRRKTQRLDASAAAIGISLLLILAVIWSCVLHANAISQEMRNKQTAHEIAELMRAKGYEEDHPVIVACQEWWQAEHAKQDTAWMETIAIGETAEYTTKEQRAQYPEAAAIWQLLRENGIDEIHAAAILGNAMSESGGNTLDLNLYQRVDGYYGVWAMSLRYFPEVDGQGAPGQVAVLLDTLESNITAGAGSVSYWWSITDVREAAKYFSDYWERPTRWAESRADNAETALRYFGGR